MHSWQQVSLAGAVESVVVAAGVCIPAAVFGGGGGGGVMWVCLKQVFVRRWAVMMFPQNICLGHGPLLPARFCLTAPALQPRQRIHSPKA